MDWLRRNWPDLLIGLALIAVIAGIIATLISGGSFFPGGNRTAENPATSSTPLTGAPAVGTEPSQSTVDTGDQLGTPSASDQPAAAGQPADTADAGAADAGTSTPAGSLTATPSTPATTPSTTPSTTPASDAGAGSTAAADSGASLPVAVLPPSSQTSGAATADQPAAATPGTPAASSVTSTPAAGAGSTSSTGSVVAGSADPEAPFRVSVGAYGNRENAERQAETFRAAGYPVFIGTQGELNIVLVGPYDDEAEARTVADRIRGGDFGVTDPTVYEFSGDDEPTATASTSTVTSSAGSAATPAAGSSTVVADDTVITSSPTASSGVRYLQAGAYGSRESSLPQRERLEGLGFVVTERVEDELVKLLIGPFDAANLENAESRLEAAGIASFPR